MDGVLGHDAQHLIKRLCDQIAMKWEKSHSEVMVSWRNFWFQSFRYVLAIYFENVSNIIPLPPLKQLQGEEPSVRKVARTHARLPY